MVSDGKPRRDYSFFVIRDVDAWVEWSVLFRALNIFNPSFYSTYGVTIFEALFIRTYTVCFLARFQPSMLSIFLSRLSTEK